MKVKEGQIFNLMDTNGRRSDVINALQGYLSILKNIRDDKKMIWASMPESLAQYEFYRQALEMSPDVFSKHSPFDNLTAELETMPEFVTAVKNNDLTWINTNKNKYSKFIKKFDLGIEDRARHYTSNLVKLGFADEDRAISEVGDLLLKITKVKKDEIEEFFPVDEVNLIYLRQALKLRIFDNSGEQFYAPFVLAIIALLERNRLSENEFSELIQGISPYSQIEDIQQYIAAYSEGDIVNDINIDIPSVILQSELLSYDDFCKNFKNRKSNSWVEIYWLFYNKIWDYYLEPNSDSLDELLTFYEANRTLLNKAFGKGKNVFSTKKGVRPEVSIFNEKNKSMFENNLNVWLYKNFILSKMLDQIREYSDTTKRIFKATGIISFDNGYVELANRELCECIFDEKLLIKSVKGNVSREVHSLYESYDEYEEGIHSYFCKNTSFCEIMQLYGSDVNNIKQKIKKKFNAADLNEIISILSNKRKLEFQKFLQDKYPVDKVKEILRMFENRNKDKIIKAYVSEDATIPTIYEYMVGIAWFYFSGKKIDLLSSYNLTLSADFEPLVHAGGGQGDIVIYENDKVVMLEATLMNANTQKRGEWEPVLRHSINLKVEEENSGEGRQVTTFFVADEFDYNTVNIWKAVAAVPLQSSVNKDKFTDNVVIMPIKTEELCTLMDKHGEYNNIINQVHSLFEVEKSSFDIGWRKKFIENII